MVQRLNLMSPREKGDKTYWTKVGTAWPSKKNAGFFDLEFDALPLPDKDGRVRVLMFEPKEDGQFSKPQPAYSNAPLSEQLNDDLSF
jgi:hypothetical protein